MTTLTTTTADPLTRAAHFFEVGSCPVRLRILEYLEARDRTVNEVAGMLGVRQQTASHHLRRLRMHGMACYRRTGQETRYAIDDAGVLLLGMAWRAGREGRATTEC
jgi:DNA-binding transcriptional ArsR family regulator